MANFATARTGVKNNEGWGRSSWDPTQMVVRGRMAFNPSGTMSPFNVGPVITYFIDTANPSAIKIYYAPEDDLDATDWTRRYPA